MTRSLFLFLIIATCPGCATTLLWGWTGSRTDDAVALLGIAAEADTSRLYVRVGFADSGPRTFAVDPADGSAVLLDEDEDTPRPLAAGGSPRSRLELGPYAVFKDKWRGLQLEVPERQQPLWLRKEELRLHPIQWLMPLCVAWDLGTLPVQLVIFAVVVWL